MKINPRKILIIRLSSIGDVLLTTPTIKILKNKFPEASISFLVEDKSAGIIKSNPYLDEVIVFSKKEMKQISRKQGKLSAFKYILNFIHKLKNKNFDLVIDLHSVFRSGIFSFFTFADFRIGIKKQLISFLYTDKIEPLPEEHVVDEYLSTLKILDIDYQETRKDFTINIPLSTKLKVNELINTKKIEKKKKIAIVPSTSKEKKDWNENKFAVIADWLIEKKDVSVFLLGSPSEKEKCIKILNRVLAIAIVSVGVYYVTLANDIMAKGFELQELKQEKQSLERVNEQLNSRVASLRSYSNLASRANNLNMVSADNIDYITAGRSMVAKK